MDLAEGVDDGELGGLDELSAVGVTGSREEIITLDDLEAI